MNTAIITITIIISSSSSSIIIITTNAIYSNLFAVVTWEAEWWLCSVHVQPGPGKIKQPHDSADDGDDDGDCDRY